MHKSLQAICDELDALSALVINSWTSDATLSSSWGWSFPALTRHDLGSIPKGIADRIRDVAIRDIDSEQETILLEIPPKLQALKTNSVVTYMFNGHGNQAVPVYMATMDWLRIRLEPFLANWQALSDNKAMPAHLARRLRSIQAGLDEIVPDKEALHRQIALINEATDAAESLPLDMQQLKKARKEIERLSGVSAEAYGKIDEHNKNAKDAIDRITKQEEEAKALVEQCGEAYLVTTSKGLASAFDQRASRLGNSIWLWSFGLVAALGLGAWIGSLRIELLSEALQEQSPQWGVISIHIVLSLLSVGAPLWFAWLSTKQIGQRFRLSEDYAFKASVAKAYEGYRREAARIDEAFEARLFSSALSRLEESPLRLVEHENHGSPWQELISSKAFQTALASVPELRDKFIEIAKEGVKHSSKFADMNKVVPEAEVVQKLSDQGELPKN